MLSHVLWKYKLFSFEIISMLYCFACWRHLCFLAALLFGGKVKVNPAHPKQIGSIDPHCRVSEVIKGENIFFFLFLRVQTFEQRQAVTVFKYAAIRVFMCCCCSFLKTNVFLVDAYENARNLCDRYYMNSPELTLEEFNGNLFGY